MPSRTRSTTPPETTSEKKTNIYKVTTTMPPADQGPLVEHVDYVRAKTLAGAKAVIAERYIAGSLATQEDLIKLAGVNVVEK